MSIVTRVCTGCKTERPLDDFYIQAEERKAARGGYSKAKLHCRYCQRERIAARRKPRQDYVDKIKAEAGCMDCGLRPEVLAVLEFDHRDPSQKSDYVSRMMYTGTFEALVEEVAKCDVVCANCHRIRTIKSKQLGGHFGKPRVDMRQFYKDVANGLGHIWGAEMLARPEKETLDVPLF